MTNTSNHNNFRLRSILDEKKLDGSNLYDWYRNLRIVLKREGKEYVLQRPLPEKLGSNASHAVYDAWDKHYTDVVNVRSLILATMSSDLREQCEKMESPIEIITSLKHRFQGQTRVERFEIVKSLIRCKLQEGNPVGRHFNMILGYIKYLDQLDCPISDKMTTIIILNSLPSCFDQFVRNYVNNGLTKTLTELHGMLKTEEQEIKKGIRDVLRVQKGKGFKKPRNDKGRNKVIQISDQDGPMCSLRPKSGSSYDKGRNKVIQISDQDGPMCSLRPKSSSSNECSYCKELGHLITNCSKFLEDLDRLKMKYESSS